MEKVIKKLQKKFFYLFYFIFICNLLDYDKLVFWFKRIYSSLAWNLLFFHYFWVFLLQNYLQPFEFLSLFLFNQKVEFFFWLIFFYYYSFFFFVYFLLPIFISFKNFNTSSITYLFTNNISNYFLSGRGYQLIPS